ncbi:MAG: hypothetical protein ACOC2W_04115 [bacterium]
MKFYTGIGSRKVPYNIMNIMTIIATKLSERDYILRSGGANGSDNAFEKEVINNNKDIYLPSSYFNGRKSNMINYYDVTQFNNYNIAYDIALKNHPNFNVLSPFVKKLMTRNTYQILGKDLETLSDFVICWTPDGCSHHNERRLSTGGTGQAISIASKHNIQIFNLCREDHKIKLFNFIKNL